jgi:hypothetical protein
MAIVIVVTLATCAAAVVVLIRLVRQLAVAGGRLPVTAEWIDELSAERYRPMLRLLDNREIRFLKHQPGFTPRMAAKLRAERCRIFCGYLRCLKADFGRICTALKIVMVQSRYDRADLAAALLKSQVTFVLLVAAATCRAFLYRWGLASVDAHHLVQLFDHVRIELRTLVPAALPASA